MAELLAVVGLDAADYELVNYWGVDNIRLDRCAQLETYSYGTDHPVTLEVWPTIATGLHASEHGVGADEKANEWESSFLNRASSVGSSLFPDAVKPILYNWVIGNVSDKQMFFGSTDADHPFDSLYQWPGIEDASDDHFATAFALPGKIDSAAHDMTERDVLTTLYRLLGDELGWLAAQEGLAGTHTHILDSTGHLYCDDEERYRGHYRAADAALGWIRNLADEMIVLSDHGMQCDWIDGDDSPGTHSRRAMVGATSGIESLPDSVFDVRDWLEAIKPEGQIREREAVSGTTRAQLEDMGYL